MELTVEYIPALIIAKDKDGNYIKISETKQNEEYHCPVCGGIVKPRAIGSAKIQPHFYHVTETNCDNESILHWMFKNWLFEKGSKFIIDDIKYKVNDFYMEKKVETPYGDYIPDLTIETDLEEIYFEINYSSSKDKTYADKWTYLNKKVVEVNVKELINSELYNTIPKFSVIFSDGEYKKQYKTHERKDKYIEFKNYIIDSKKEEQIKYIAEKFDWFWKEIKEESDEDIKLCINSMDYDDSVNCCRFLKKIKCVDKYEICKKETNNRIIDVIKEIVKEDDFSICFRKISAQKYSIFVYKNKFGEKVGEEIQIRSYDGIISRKILEEEIGKLTKLAKEIEINVEKTIKKISDFEIDGYQIEKIINLKPSKEVYNYDVFLIANIYIKDYNEWIRCYDRVVYPETSYEYIYGAIKSVIDIFTKRKEEEKLQCDFISEWINDKKIKEINDLIIDKKYKIVSSEKYLSLELNNILIKSYDYKYNKPSIEIILNDITEYEEFYVNILKLSEKINNCKNNFWLINFFDSDNVILYVKENKEINRKIHIYRERSYEKIKRIIEYEMNKIIKYPNYNLAYDKYRIFTQEEINEK